MTTTTGSLLRPRLRGVIHLWATPVAVVLFVVLVARATAADRVAVSVYAVCVTAMLAVSATYHSGRLSPVWFVRLKRLDHSTILLAIAGSYTAVIGLALEGKTRSTFLVLVWAAATVGILLRMFWLHAPYPVVAVVYVVVGWMAVLDLPAFVHALSGIELALFALGGVLYTVGAAVYAVHKPNPWPATFGYHEIFHGLVVLAALAHYVAVYSLAGRA
ncbi:MAG: hemolysin III family protein [Actinobacteria bacterium]|nr:hemolysin III family protein [Actinomycetota bacterium]